MKTAAILLMWAELFFKPGVSMAQSTAIVNATVIDGTGAAARPGAAILIEGKKIAAVGRKEQLQIPAGAKVIDGAGKFVIPGIIDTNVHLVLNTAPEWMGKYEGRFDQVATEAAQVELKNGVTTLFDSWVRCSRCSTSGTASAEGNWWRAGCTWPGTSWA